MILTVLESGTILAICICIIESDFDRGASEFMVAKVKITFGGFLENLIIERTYVLRVRVINTVPRDGAASGIKSDATV